MSEALNATWPGLSAAFMIATTVTASINPPQPRFCLNSPGTRYVVIWRSLLEHRAANILTIGMNSGFALPQSMRMYQTLLHYRHRDAFYTSNSKLTSWAPCRTVHRIPCNARFIGLTWATRCTHRTMASNAHKNERIKR